MSTTNWQQMETAPLNERILLTSILGYVAIGEVRENGLITWDNQRRLGKAVAWMALPAPVSFKVRYDFDEENN